MSSWLPVRINVTVFQSTPLCLKRMDKNEPAPLGTGSTCSRQNLLLLHGYADIVHIHVGEVSVSVLVVVEVDTNGLAFVRGQVISHLRPCLSVGADHHDLLQRGAGSILHLSLLRVVGDVVGGGGPVAEDGRRRGCGGASGRR